MTTKIKKKTTLYYPIILILKNKPIKNTNIKYNQKHINNFTNIPLKTLN